MPRPRKKPEYVEPDFIDLDPDDYGIQRVDIGYQAQLHRIMTIIDALALQLDGPENIRAWRAAIRELEAKLFPYWGSLSKKNIKLGDKPKLLYTDKKSHYGYVHAYLSGLKPKDALKQLTDEQKYKLDDNEKLAIQMGEEMAFILVSEKMRYQGLLALMDKWGLLFQRTVRGHL